MDLYGTDAMHIDILNAAQQSVLTQLAPALTGHDFYLAGGTALALQ